MMLTHQEHMQLHADLCDQGNDPVDANDSTVIKERERQRLYRESHREELAEKQRARYHANREAILTQMKQYRNSHPERLAKRKHDYYVRNKEAIIKHQKEYTDANREAILARKRVRSRLYLAIKFNIPTEIIDQLRKEYDLVETKFQLMK